jgi:hypothetical protein
MNSYSQGKMALKRRVYCPRKMEKEPKDSEFIGFSYCTVDKVRASRGLEPCSLLRTPRLLWEKLYRFLHVLLVSQGNSVSHK